MIILNAEFKLEKTTLLLDFLQDYVSSMPTEDLFCFLTNTVQYLVNNNLFSLDKIYLVKCDGGYELTHEEEPSPCKGEINLQIISPLFKYYLLFDYKHRMMIVDFLSRYFSKSGNSIWNELCKIHKKNLHNNVSTKIKEYLKNSQFVAETSSDIGKWFIEKDCTSQKDMFCRGILKHLECLTNDNIIAIKKDVKRSVSRYCDGDESVIIKDFKNHFPYVRTFSPVVRSWVSAKRVLLMDIPSVSYKAVCYGKDHQDFIIMEDLGQEDLVCKCCKLIDNKDKELLNEELYKVAKLVANLHDLGVYHRDLKLVNFMSLNNEIKLIDLDDITLHNKVSEQRIIKNINQISGSMPKGINNLSRMRFILTYSKLRFLKKEEIFNLIKKSHMILSDHEDNII